MDWTGLDWPYTDQNSCTQTANVAKAMKSCLQLCLKLLPSLLRHHSSISERSKVTCIFNELQKKSLWLNSCGFSTGFEYPSLALTVSYRDHTHLLAKNQRQNPPVRMLCLLEGLEERLLSAQTKLQPFLKCRTRRSMHVTLLWPVGNRGMIPQQARKQLETELETTLHSLVTFAVCVQLFWSIQSSPLSSSESSPQSSPESRVQVLYCPFRTRLHCINRMRCLWFVWLPCYNVLYIKNIINLLQNQITVDQQQTSSCTLNAMATKPIATCVHSRQELPTGNGVSIRQSIPSGDW